MRQRIECYYDYRSPFPYFAIGPVAELAQRHDALADWIPIRLPGLSTYRERPMGHTLTKRVTYIAIDAQRWARRRGVFDAYHAAVSHALWGRGEDLGQRETLARAVSEAGIDAVPFLREAGDTAVGDELSRLTREADERGVFGVPTFFVGDEMFWGQDRLDFVEEALKAPGAAFAKPLEEDGISASEPLP